jgi:hypothetical protein
MHAARGELIKNAELLNKLSCSQPYNEEFIVAVSTEL